jgi:hypothetical protein
MDNLSFEKKKLEYTAAQEMLSHYDSLNWQIGSILIAATIVLTGLVLRQEVICIVKMPGLLSWLIAVGIPLFSFFVLGIWFLWFKRHRDLYNFRNETLHRLELELGLYHHLRAVEADLSLKPCSSDKNKILDKAKTFAGYGKEGFSPFYSLSALSGPSGFKLAKVLVVVIPSYQLVLLLSMKFA